MYAFLFVTPVASASQPVRGGVCDSMIVSEEDSGNKVQMAPEGVLILKLTAIPGTGYAWHLVRNEPHLLKPCGGSFFEPMENLSDKPIGASAYQVFCFRTRNKGTALLELHYRREWEKKEVPLKRFIITVQIHKRKK
jgi:predicted secreted protein